MTIQFPTMLRKMWSGSEVQKWIDDNVVKTTTITFKYLNHRGEHADRTIDVEAVEFIREPGFGYQSGWFVSGRCHDKDARRSFALNRILFNDQEQVPKIFTLLNLKPIPF